MGSKINAAEAAIIAEEVRTSAETGLFHAIEDRIFTEACAGYNCTVFSINVGDRIAEKLAASGFKVTREFEGLTSVSWRPENIAEVLGVEEGGEYEKEMLEKLAAAGIAIVIVEPGEYQLPLLGITIFVKGGDGDSVEDNPGASEDFGDESEDGESEGIVP